MNRNKRTSVTLVLVMWLLSTAGYGQEQQTSFSLEEAVNFAILNNQTAKNARLDMEIAERQVDEIVSTGLPQVNANADFTYNYKIQEMVLPANTFDPTADPNTTIATEFGIDYTSTFGLSATQMIFDGSFIVGLEAAKTFTELSKKDNIKNNIDVAEAVSKAYFGVLVNRERFELVKSNFARVDSLLNDTRLLYESGMAEKIDVSRVKVQYNNLKVELDNYEAVVHLTESLLKFQMGLPSNATVELTDDIQSINFFDFSLANNFSYDHRIEYAQLNVRQDLNELDIKNVRAQYYPKVDLFASYGRNTGNTEFSGVFTDQWFGAGAVGLRFSMPVFDGMMKRRQVQQKQLAARQITNQFELLQYNIDYEIEQAEANYRKQVENIEAQRENMGLAQEVYDVAKIKYEEGVGSNIEVIDADREYKEAQTNFYNAVYEALISKVELQKAYGVLL
ncbi:TolC family protein [Reichenbachiella sp. MSK19-1]|uniref:TolC family protein n=1 Tax=Reichenbachiella sp. MSK19-1 TaxID=1897631 RepID=UPI000E6C42FA|nr:TolC family protein [Reichenbachiella sp. MSK19-1]